MAAPSFLKLKKREMEEEFESFLIFPFEVALRKLKEGKVLYKMGGDSVYFMLKANVVPLGILHDPMLIGVCGAAKIEELECKASIRKLRNTGELVTGWTPSMEDLFAEDWAEFEMSLLPSFMEGSVFTILG